MDNLALSLLFLFVSTFGEIDGGTDLFYRHLATNSIASTTGQTNIIYSETKNTIGLLGLATDNRNNRTYWSTGRGIQSSKLDGSDVKDFVGSIYHISMSGYRFGNSRNDLLAIYVNNQNCHSIIWSSNKISCLIAIASYNAILSEKNIKVQTVYGSMTGKTNSPETMISDSYTSPIVSSIEIVKTNFQPHALAIWEDLKTSAWLIVSDSSSATIYRVNLHDYNIVVVMKNVWKVFGLAVLNSHLYYTDSAKGTVSKLYLPANATSSVIIAGLSQPRGLCMDKINDEMYIAEKVGKIFRVKCDGSNLYQNYSLTPAIYKELILSISTSAILNRIAFDPKTRYLYWSESNTNVIARASLIGMQREVITGYNKTSIIRWPRDLSMDNEGNLIFADYFGRIYKGKKDGSNGFKTIVDILSSLRLQNVDDKQLLSSKSGGSYSTAFGLE